MISQKDKVFQPTGKRRRTLRPFVNKVICGDALDVLGEMPDDSVHVAITSPPYWDVVDYGVAGQIGQSSYQEYLDDLLNIWRETQPSKDSRPIIRKQVNSIHFSFCKRASKIK